jgi:hypothetical protein
MGRSARQPTSSSADDYLCSQRFQPGLEDSFVASARSTYHQKHREIAGIVIGG